jgi:DNA polymerase III subunit epsilon
VVTTKAPNPAASPPVAFAKPGSLQWRTQESFDELGTPLHQVSFTVVDLETTGGSPESGAHITEIGAVKVRAGEPSGEFQTLVKPGEVIPPFITSLTGITNSMTAGAPTIKSVLPSFLEFAHGTVLVAHNAGFDTHFLKHAAHTMDLAWPSFVVVDTAVLSRHVLFRDEVANHKLSTLARHFRSTTAPNHRALDDARATVDVLHGLLARVGNLGVHTLEDLVSFTNKVSQSQRSKRHLAAHLAHTPGVYVFRDREDRPLYVGTSRDLRSRVQRYFTRSETRSRIGEMVTIAARVEGIECATALEAAVRELRLIHAHRPPYNKRSKFPERAFYLVTTREPWPRLKVVKRIGNQQVHFGPFRSRRLAETASEIIALVFGVRTCRDQLPARATSRSGCLMYDLNKCEAPCTASISPTDYQSRVARLKHGLAGHLDSVFAALYEQMSQYSADQRFEEASSVRDRLHNLILVGSCSQRLTTLSQCKEIVAIRHTPHGTWEVHVIRQGRLAASGNLPGGAVASEYIATLLRLAEHVTVDHPRNTASVEEMLLIDRWLALPGVRLVSLQGEWSSPIHSPQRWVSLLKNCQPPDIHLPGSHGSADSSHIS